ncbi:MAG: T9SS type A sorting domain-containing protein [Flavobacteriales bacterium]
MAPMASVPFRILTILALIASSSRPFEVAAQSSSDACGFAGANQYTVNSTCSFQTFNKPTSYVNNMNPGGCSSSTNDDAFGWFQATSTVTAITYDPLTNLDAILHVFSGACGSLTQLGCSNIGGNGVNESVTIATTIGTNYQFRVQRNGSDALMDGSICVYNPVSNDIPCTATALTVNTTCASVAGTNLNSTDYFTGTVPVPGCAAYTGGDVWFSFVAPAVGSINIETSAGTLTDGGVAIYSAATCAGPFTLISCDDNSGPGNMGQAQASGLTIGTTYYARVWGNGGATGTFSICAHALANDNPCGATSLTVGTSCASVSSTNINATTTTGPPAPGCAAFSAADVWFSFAAPSNGSIAIQTTAGTLNDGGAAIYSATSCAGPFTLLACDDNNGLGNMSLVLYNGLTVGTTYYVRIWGNGGGTGTFDICAYSLPNDNPCGATLLTLGISCTATSSTNVAATTTTGPPAPGCAAFSSADVWFRFVAPAGGAMNIETTAGSLTDGGMAIYSAASCAGAFTLVACDDNNGPGNMSYLARTGLTPGATYYVRVWGNGGATGTFNICAVAPLNDNPCTAYALAVNSTCTNTAASNVGATNTAGPPAPTCASYTGGDVWFSFVAPANGVANIETTAGTLTDSGMELYSATACNGTFTSIQCDNNGGAGNMSEILRTGLTSGQTYYIRLWGLSGATGTFSICVWATPPPANDDPCGAVALTVNTSCSLVGGTNVGSISTTGVPAPTCASYSGGDVWFTFVAPASGMANISTSANGLTNSGMELYSATACNGTFTSIECDDDDGSGNMSAINRTGLTPGQTYYVRIWGSGGARGTFNICVWDPAPPANDAPCSATVVTLGTTCVNGTYTNENATLSAGIAAPGCGGLNGSSRDVWFSFVAPSTGNVNFNFTAGTLSDPAMALYVATACNGTFTLIECDDDDGPGSNPFLYLYDLVPGTTYYLRVWGDGGNTGTFDLCAVIPATTGNCFYALQMIDSGGDGWGGSTVGVSINSGAYTNYTLTTGNRSVAYIPVNLGDIVVLNYTAVGGFQNEISYILQSGFGILFSAGPTPGTGVVYAHVNDCVAPDAPKEDCYGGTTVCGGSSINANPSGTGLKPDLNVNTRGCLSNDERQGTWFNFSPSASGTVEFTIVPSNPGDDYDFAVWGPTPSLSCPPSTAPYRCSYSGNTGNTGLLLGSGDDSEGAGGNKFVNAMTVITGEVYVLYVSNWSQSGLSFDLTWNLTNGSSLDCTVLPIELLSFRADALNTAVDLNWVTASESGNSHFVVERSADGEHFAAIGQVQGAGDSYTTNTYVFSDQYPSRGINYYRLKQVDFDGTSTYSQVETASFGLSIIAGTPYPNPAGETVNVKVEMKIAGKVELQLLDASGRLVHSSVQTMDAGERTLSVPVRGLDPGSYLLSMIAGDGTEVKAGRFIVQ